MQSFRSIRRLALTGITVLVATTLLGGLVLAAAEGQPLLEGLWLAFAVVSTTGFGEGPVTAPGMVISMGLFVVAVVGYLFVLASAVAMAHHVVGPPGRRERPMLVERDVRKIVRDMHQN